MSVTIGTVPTFADVSADKAQALKVMEEAAEVFSAWQEYEDSRNNGLSTKWPQADLLEECADLIQATCNLLAALGVRDMQEAMLVCRRKNERRGWRYGDDHM